MINRFTTLISKTNLIIPGGFLTFFISIAGGIMAAKLNHSWAQYQGSKRLFLFDRAKEILARLSPQSFFHSCRINEAKNYIPTDE